MPTPTYTPLANLTVSSAASTVNFASIPSTYRDLIIVVQAKNSTTGNIQLRIQFNSDTSSIYSRQRVGTDGGTASAATLTSTFFQFTSNSEITETDGYHGIFHFLDYSATNKHKTVLAKSNNASMGVDAFSGRWANTNAVTSIQVFSNDNFATGSTFALYGIVA